ncbi:MAG: hypothetical protein EOO03_16500, partial [Chitinophagaceae bacterium]
MSVKLTVNQTFIIAIVLAVAVFLFILGIYKLQFQQHERSVALMYDTQEALVSLEKLNAVATELETESTAYILTGQQPFLSAYQKAQTTFLQLQKELTARLGNDPRQHSNLNALTKTVLEQSRFADSLISKQNNNKVQSAASMLPATSTQYLRTVQQLITAIKSQEDELLREERMTNESEVRKEKWTFMSLALFVLLMLLLLFWRERKRMLKQEHKKVETQFKLMADNMSDYAIFMLDQEGRMLSWNQG